MGAEKVLEVAAVKAVGDLAVDLAAEMVAKVEVMERIQYQNLQFPSSQKMNRVHCKCSFWR